MSYSSRVHSLAKVFKSENYSRGQVEKKCVKCKGPAKVITEFATRTVKGRIYLKSRCRQCDTSAVIEARERKEKARRLSLTVHAPVCGEGEPSGFPAAHPWGIGADAPEASAFLENMRG